ncbi:MAG: 16S rRNA (guanine(966)-N(2))-methyltransferase RsmD [Betaproteobacteria bacterium]|nr:16S rRNA (guanine(966)-N(2))-methyltransferase RsmD [Betaproteobacteria bacterium]
MGSRGVGQVRIIGGAYRRRLLAFPSRPGLRPTPDRVRETLFNWLGQSLRGLACLDLFAGCGGLGFEAASRGAHRVVMVERDRAAFAALAANRERLHASSVELVCADAFAWLDRAAECFDVVFLDPPFRQNSLPQAMERLPPVLRHGARVYLECESALAAEGMWRELRAARAGQVSYQLLEWGHDDPGSVSRDL